MKDSFIGLHKTLQLPSAIFQVQTGSFSNKNAIEVISNHGTGLSLRRLIFNEQDDEADPQYKHICSQDMFSHIRSLSVLKPSGSDVDLIIVGSDSGNVDVLKFDEITNRFQSQFSHPIGRTGSRRDTPGQITAVTPNGDTFLIGSTHGKHIMGHISCVEGVAVEGPYQLPFGEDSLTFDICGLSSTSAGQSFAFLEVDLSSIDSDTTGAAAGRVQKCVSFVHISGLNQVRREVSVPVHPSVSKIMAVPHRNAVIAFGEDHISFIESHSQQAVHCWIPRRENWSAVPNHELGLQGGCLAVDVATLVSASSNHMFVVMETGDLFKIQISGRRRVGSDGTQVSVEYIESLPPPAAIAVFRAGYLFHAADGGDHAIYRFLETNVTVTASSQSTPQRIDALVAPPRFTPAWNRNVERVMLHPSLSPLNAMRVLPPGFNHGPRLLAATGRGARAQMRILEQGTSLDLLGGFPVARSSTHGTVFSFGSGEEHWTLVDLPEANSTVVVVASGDDFSIQDTTEWSQERTLWAGMMCNGCTAQITPSGIIVKTIEHRFIPVQQLSGSEPIVAADSNGHQLCVLTPTRVLLFRIWPTSPSPSLVHERRMPNQVSCSIAPITADELAQFVVVVDQDAMVSLLSLLNALQTCGSKLSSHPIESVLLQKVDTSLHCIWIGFKNGVLSQTPISRDGAFQADTQHLVGQGQVRMCRGVSDGWVIAMASRIWCVKGQSQLPLLLPGLVSICPFSRVDMDVCVTLVRTQNGLDLQLSSFPNPSGTNSHSFSDVDSHPLSAMARRLVVLPGSRALAVTREDVSLGPNVPPHDPPTHQLKPEDGIAIEEDAFGSSEDDSDSDSVDPAGTAADPEALGHVKAPGARWGGLELLKMNAESQGSDSLSSERISSMLPSEWSPICCVTLQVGRRGPPHLVIGAVDLQHQQGALFLVRDGLNDAGVSHASFSLVNVTSLPSPPTALSPFRGKLLVACGSVLTLFRVGKTRFLKLCFYDGFPTTLVSVLVHRDQRIFVADAAESFYALSYLDAENQLVLRVQDEQSRWVTTGRVVDRDTIVGADKFGNLFMLRIPTDVSEELAADPPSIPLSVMGPARIRYFVSAMQFHVGETITSIHLTRFMEGDTERVILFSTQSGRIGMVRPILSQESADWLHQLQIIMQRISRGEHSTQISPLGRDHCAFRSLYDPLCGVIDYDFLVQYQFISSQLQQQIADELKTPIKTVLDRISQL
eukprot:gnl/Dysnectes_brevis/5977_a8944_403.p1 GENE.gnl/Dysnectes_brevis/5977_a8944_403~~gnl/Dysnectes_brevis/5977_a8944_403.p1  ORF type:complete len:1226 (-),score=110.85 gnl/Dysnectes_brevis/5977_a8944_403:28-3705(-)